MSHAHSPFRGQSRSPLSSSSWVLCGGSSPLPHLGLSPGPPPGRKRKPLPTLTTRVQGCLFVLLRTPGPRGRAAASVHHPVPGALHTEVGPGLAKLTRPRRRPRSPLSWPREACEWVERLGWGPRSPGTPQHPALTCVGDALTKRASPAVCAFHTPHHSPAFKQGPDGQPEVLCPAPPQVTRMSRKQTRSESPGFGSLCVCAGQPRPPGAARPGTVPDPAAPGAESGNRVPAVLGRAWSSEAPTPTMDMTLAPAHSRGPHTLAVGERRAGPAPLPTPRTQG